MPHRFIVAFAAHSEFLLIRATADDDGEVIARGTRGQMVALRDSLLSAEHAVCRRDGGACLVLLKTVAPTIHS